MNEHEKLDLAGKLICVPSVPRPGARRALVVLYTEPQTTLLV